METCLASRSQLLAKNPDSRYQSAHGLQADLMQCQRRLLNAVTLAADESQEVRRAGSAARTALT